MRILLVAILESTHTARWISQINNLGWDIHLFPSIDSGRVHPLLKDVTIHHCLYSTEQAINKKVRTRGIPVCCKGAEVMGKSLLRKLAPELRAMQLSRLVKRLKPHIVHSLEIQHAGYLTLKAKGRSGNTFAPWIVTNWGSDIYLFGRLSEHEHKIRAVLEGCDYYSCECERDVELARAYGFKGTVLPVIPNSGGFDLEFVSQMRQPGEVSRRRLIVLKGYQSWSGRALVGLRALERCADLLEGYEIALYSASPEVIVAAELFEKSTGISTTVIPKDSPHDKILKLHGRARISIGLSISDAISTSVLEAMVMGSFPIQSYTSCADEWIEDGKTGLLVPPEDPDVVEQAIRRALSSDELVNRAEELNELVVQKRLDHGIVKQMAIQMYNIVSEKKVSIK